LPLFEVIDTIAAMRWTDAEIPALVRRLSSALNEEVDLIARLDQEPVVSGHP
jgi:hypothetical protein